MKQTFVNFTNHPSDKWQSEQKSKALEYGDIVDLAFPVVDAMADEQTVMEQAERCVTRIMEFHPGAVLCQGEFCLAYQVITMLKERGVTVLAACSEREAKESPQDGGTRKESIFRFKQFRRY